MMGTDKLSASKSSSASASKIANLRFQKLFEDADAMSIQGYLCDGTVVYWNRASELIYGYSPEEAIGGNLLDLIIPAQMRAKVEGAVRWMFETGQGIPPSRMTLRHKDGRGVPVYSSHTVVSIDGQRPVLFCMDADMSALAQAEDDLRIAATAFESQQGMLVSNAESVILRVNHAFTRITGYSAAEAVGQHTRLLTSGRHDATTFKTMYDDLAHQGSWQGEIWNRRKDGEVYPAWLTISAVKDADGQITHYVSIFTDISSSKIAENQIKTLAFYDPLTHLPNRRLFLDRLAQAKMVCARRASHGALLFVDLDNFKTLNDTLGFVQGDVLLEQVASRLTACVREGDTVARLGGDEFVVMLEDLAQDEFNAANEAKAIGEKIRHALSQSYALGVSQHHSTPSIGLALFGAEQPETDDDPLKRAELAMYQAKTAGRNALRFFDPQMQVEVTQRATLENDLRECLEQNQLILYYQAQVTDDGTLTGAEALVRWLHPQRGLVSPDEFIPLAEETGLILPLGQWVLETACIQLASWATQQPLRELTLAVNVSAKQFGDDNFVPQLLALLTRTGANPKRLKLELTESMLVNDVESVIQKMTAIKAIGVGSSLDDFGTGYSSLTYLKRLPLDQLKIDQGFVRNILTDPNDSAIAKMVVALADSMGLAVIAEGVETREQKDFLANIGCHAYQGYFFSRPVPLAGYEKFVTHAQRNLVAG